MEFKVEIEATSPHPFKTDKYEEEDISYGPSTSQKTTQKFSNNLPTLNDEKPMVGPMGAGGNLKIRYQSHIDGYEPDHKELSKMKMMGLPTGFMFDGYGHKQKVAPEQTRGFKKTFYCHTCKIDLSSEDTMVSHLKGSKHMKRKLAEEERQLKEGKSMEGPEIVQIKNPEPTRTKVPIRLQEKIMETSNPVVGLQYIREFIPVSDPEMEPHYECSLCESQGQANSMFSHLMGQKHRKNFVNKELGFHTILSQAELLEKAVEYNENCLGFQIAETIRSDEDYPWPSGKEPWSKLKGGTGIAPLSARMNYGNKQFKSEDDFIKTEAIRRTVPTSSKVPTFTLPSKDDINTPKSIQGCKKMLDLGRKLLMTVADYNGCGMRHKQRALLITCLDIVARRISVAKPLSADRLLHGLPRLLPSAAVTTPKPAQSASRYSEASNDETKYFGRFSAANVKTVDDSSEKKSSSPTPVFSRRSLSPAHSDMSFREGGHRVRSERSPSYAVNYNSGRSCGEDQDMKRTRRNRSKDRNGMGEEKSSSPPSFSKRSTTSAYGDDREVGHRVRNGSSRHGYEEAQGTKRTVGRSRDSQASTVTDYDSLTSNGRYRRNYQDDERYADHTRDSGRYQGSSKRFKNYEEDDNDCSKRFRHDQSNSRSPTSSQRSREEEEKSWSGKRYRRHGNYEEEGSRNSSKKSFRGFVEDWSSDVRKGGHHVKKNSRSWI